MPSTRKLGNLLVYEYPIIAGYASSASLCISIFFSMASDREAALKKYRTKLIEHKSLEAQTKKGMRRVMVVVVLVGARRGRPT